MFKQLIAEFIIPKYLREIQVSNKQRPKYFIWDGITIKAKSKKLLQKYINKEHKDDITRLDGNIRPYHLNYPYFIVRIVNNKVIGIYGDRILGTGKFIHNKGAYTQFNYKLTKTDSKKPVLDILINIDTKEKVIANSTQVGKPKRIIIKGQDMYSGVLNEFTRAKIVNELKEDYYKKIDDSQLFKVSHIIGTKPIFIELQIIDTIKNYYDKTKEGEGIRWDVGNRAYPYLKTFVDFLVNNNVLIDDDRLHVVGEGYYFTPCENHENRKLIFRIYKV